MATKVDADLKKKPFLVFETYAILIPASMVSPSKVDVDYTPKANAAARRKT